MKDEDFKKLGEQVTAVTVTHSFSKMVLEQTSIGERELKKIVFREAQLKLVNDLWERKCIRVKETEDAYEKHFFFTLMLVPPDGTLHKNFTKTFTDLIEAEQRIKVLEKKLFDAEESIAKKNWCLNELAAHLRTIHNYPLAQIAIYGLQGS